MAKLYAKREASRSFHPHHNCEGKNNPKLCHPERTPDFLLHCTNQRPRMRFSLRKAALGLATPLSLTGNPEEAEGPAVLSPAKQLRRVKALKAAELLGGEAHRRSLGFARDDKLKGGGP